jgi:hypothetical protein
VRPLKTIAIVSGNLALNALMETTIAIDPRVRVRAFPDMIALAFYGRIVDIDLVVADLDSGFDEDLLENAGIVANTLVLGLTTTPERSPRIAEIIVKPASPLHVRERALALLGLPYRSRPLSDAPVHIVPLIEGPRVPTA